MRLPFKYKNMKFIHLIAFLLFCLSAKADFVNIYYNETDNGYQVLVDNDQYCPVTIKFDFKVKNLKSINDVNDLVVIPARVKGHVVTDFVVVNPRRGYRFGMQTRSNLGDHTNKNYDRDFQYHLPFKSAKNVIIGQGYNGRFSHHGENALDFDLRIGEEVYAARGGVVIEVVEKNSRNCTSSHNCANYNNYIIIHHDDGTFAEYVHLKRKGAIVEVGDKVEIGQLIGYSGKTGFASGPHLHFAVYLQELGGRETVRTKFLVDDGTKLASLREGETYKKNY